MGLGLVRFAHRTLGRSDWFQIWVQKMTPVISGDVSGATVAETVSALPTGNILFEDRHESFFFAIMILYEMFVANSCLINLL